MNRNLDSAFHESHLMIQCHNAFQQKQRLGNEALGTREASAGGIAACAKFWFANNIFKNPGSVLLCITRDLSALCN